MTDKKVPLCKDCKHRYQHVYDGLYSCLRNVKVVVSPVDGSKIHDRVPPMCSGERRKVHRLVRWLPERGVFAYCGREPICGPEGRYFEPKKEDQ